MAITVYTWILIYVQVICTEYSVSLTVLFTLFVSRMSFCDNEAVNLFFFSCISYILVVKFAIIWLCLVCSFPAIKQFLCEVFETQNSSLWNPDYPSIQQTYFWFLEYNTWEVNITFYKNNYSCALLTSEGSILISLWF